MKRILVVDDVASIRNHLGGWLQKIGHTVIYAADGEEALKKVKEEVPDFIFLDVTMPKINGFTVCYEIKKNNSTHRIPVIMVTAKREKWDEDFAKICGCDGYIFKPFEYKQIEEVLGKFNHQ